MKNFVSLLTLLLFAAVFAGAASAQTAVADSDHAMMTDGKDEVTVIKLSQTPGQYDTQALTLKPGKYVFEITNRNVDKGLGFYLQDKTDAQVPNSGVEALVEKGQTQRTGVVTLTRGEYRYSCPLNPTPHYTLTVK